MDVKTAANGIAKDIALIRVCEISEHTIDNIESIISPPVASFISIYWQHKVS